jgi:hypothetical protein
MASARILDDADAGSDASTELISSIWPGAVTQESQLSTSSHHFQQPSLK